jgi:hypothetical protein
MAPAQIALISVGGFVCALNVCLAALRHFRGRGPSPGSLGGFIPLLVVLFVQDWPLWLRFALAPLTVALEFIWVPVYFLLAWLFPRPPR